MTYVNYSEELIQLQLPTEGIFPVSQSSNYGWWIEVLTTNPICIYYFGDFESYTEAQKQINGFITDLKDEGALIGSSCIRRCRPRQLTLFLDN